ncbi:hypothetical protein E2H98_09110 [Permianibacter aggregans]|uniref:hypothetical protein n=1 Tax=Permianibacter aggregans TaxID=1510150 RepID=UPI0012F82786|nr:hypothetical protein [Permianibacter aggregans]QGX39806.1 hypothetical protein E2H98_09110 [Permianibacter aggregans]
MVEGFEFGAQIIIARHQVRTFADAVFIGQVLIHLIDIGVVTADTEHERAFQVSCGFANLLGNFALFIEHNENRITGFAQHNGACQHLAGLYAGGKERIGGIGSEQPQRQNPGQCQNVDRKLLHKGEETLFHFLLSTTNTNQS